MSEKTKNQLTPLKWTLFTTLGWVLGFALALIAGHPLEEIKLSVFSLGLGISFGVGFMQWVILRNHISEAAQWILYSVYGLGGAFLILNILQLIFELFGVTFMGDGLSFLIPSVAGAILGGYVSGFLQDKYIFRKITNQKSQWAITTAVAWLCATLNLVVFTQFIFKIHFIQAIPGPVPAILVFLSVGPIIGLITGKKIVSIMQNNITNDISR